MFMGDAQGSDIISFDKIKRTMLSKIEKIKEIQKLSVERANLINSWISIMAQTNSYNNFYDTFEIVDEKRTTYGWEFRLYASDGLTFNSLETLKPIIEHNIGCTFLWKVDQSNKFAVCKVVYTGKVKCNDIPFNPVKVKPYEICPGLDITGEPIILDVNASPHILIAGQTRKGKNGAADSIILSWINSCTEKEIELYLFQCAKIDLIKYRDCKQVKEFILLDIYDMLDILNELVEKEIPRRLSLFEDMFSSRKGENIADYNKLYPNKQLSYIYIVLDEFLELMIQPKSAKESNEIKCDILANLQRIGQMGAAVGVQYMILHQKPEKALCPTFIKNMSSIRICFGFDDESCGRIVLGDRDGSRVVNLPARRAYINNNGALELMYTPNLYGRRDMFIEPNEVKDKKSRADRHKKKVEEQQAKQIENQVKFEELDIDVPIIQSEDSLEIDKPRQVVFEFNTTDKHNMQTSGEPRINMFKFNSDSMSLDMANITESSIEYVNRADLGLSDINNTIKNNESTDLENYNADNIVDDNNKVNKDTESSYSIDTSSNIETSMYNETDIEEIQKEIDRIVASNAKKIENWVPYEPKDGDKKADISTIKESYYFSNIKKKR